MTQEATQLEVPNFEATTDGKKISTPKQWLERFRQYTKRKYKLDIAELIRVEKMTQNDWATKENQIQDDFVWRIGPEALYQMTRAEYKTEPDEIAIKDLIRLFNEDEFLVIPTKKKHIPQPRRHLLDHTNQSRETRGLLAEIDRNQKRR